MRTVVATKELRDEGGREIHAIGRPATLSNLAAYIHEIVRKGVKD